MSYMWDDFNIKTFPAETIVYRDGVYRPDLSTIENGPIDKKYNIPVHIIYVGEIIGLNKLNIAVNTPGQNVRISINIKIKDDAELDVWIRNNKKTSSVRGHVMIENNNKFKLNIAAHHAAPETEIMIHTKILGNPKSKSVLTGIAKIDKKCPNCISDIGFSALMHPNANVTFMPSQRISSIPTTADHDAAIFQASPPQIQYLRESGLSGKEVENTMREAFLNDYSLF